MLQSQLPVWLKPLWDHWQDTRSTDKLPHAMLVVGPHGSGKRVLVEAFVRGLQCHNPDDHGWPCGQCSSCKQFPSHRRLEENTHPDIDWLTISRYSIGINEIRDQVIQRLGLKANYDLLKVLVIEPAERMTRPASNALLKSLEEPPSNTLLILISHQPGRLLPTVRSRCQRYVTAVPTAEQGVEWLSNFVDSGEAEKILEACSGMPMRALQMHQDQQVQVRREFDRDLSKMLAGKLLETEFASTWNVTSTSGKSNARKQTDQDDKGESVEEVSIDSRLVWMLERVVGEVRQQLHQKASSDVVRALLGAYRELVRIRTREASIPASLLNLEMACLVLSQAYRLISEEA